MTDWLVDTLLASSALMLLVLILRGPVCRLFGAGVAYALWLLPAARMLFPPLLRTVERNVPLQSGHTIVHSPGALLLPDVAAVPGVLERLGGWSTIAISGWLLGSLAMLGYGLHQYRAQRRSILDGSMQLVRIGSIRLIRSERVRGPMAFGIVDRVIIVPLDFSDRFSESQARLALDHELGHHRSFDLVANLLAFVLLCLQWFNPLAWVAHAAFRFDQEAACDARVLDKVDECDRAIYGQAIAKAATGRALLFAGALDRPSTLSRRLTIMANRTSGTTRKIGFALVGGSILAALPLTASWAVRYVDVPSVTPSAASTIPVGGPAVAPIGQKTLAALPVAAAIAQAPASAAPAGVSTDKGYVLPGGVTLGKDDIAFFANDQIVFHGRVRRLEDLNRAERAQLRNVIAKSEREIAHERAQLPARLAEAKREIDHIKSGAYKREILRDREDLRRDLADLDSEAAELRANGENPKKRRAEILQSLREMDAIDIDKQIREELGDLDLDKIVAELRNDEQQMQRMKARLDQLDQTPH